MTAEKTTSVCSRLCRVVAQLDGETAYVIAHNSVGSAQTDCQRVYAPGMLDLPTEKLAEKIRSWVIDLHSGNRLDLNAI